jgi:hypothetical protein
MHGSLNPMRKVRPMNLRRLGSIGWVLLATILFSGCREIRRPLQIDPAVKPEIVIFQHIPYRTAPCTYVISFTDDAAKAWRESAGKHKRTFRPGEDFSVFLGRKLQDQIIAYRDIDLQVNGQIEVNPESVVVNLEIIPSSSTTRHPIDGVYRRTKQKPLTVTFRDFHRSPDDNK